MGWRRPPHLWRAELLGPPLPPKSWRVSLAAMGNPWDYDFSAIGRGAPLLIVHGSDADPAAKKQGGYRVTGNSDLFKLLPEALPFEQVNLSKAFLRRQGRPEMSRFERVLNLVTDADQHPDTL